MVCWIKYLIYQLFQRPNEESKYGNLEKWCAGLYSFLLPWYHYPDEGILKPHCLMVFASGLHSAQSNWRSNILVGKLASTGHLPFFSPSVNWDVSSSHLYFIAEWFQKEKLGFIHYAFKGSNKNNHYHLLGTYYLPGLVHGRLHSIYFHKTPVR